MADEHANELPTTADGEVVGMEQVVPPEAPPMDDASGLPQGDDTDDTDDTDEVDAEEAEIAAQLGSLS